MPGQSDYDVIATGFVKRCSERGLNDEATLYHMFRISEMHPELEPVFEKIALEKWAIGWRDIVNWFKGVMSNYGHRIIPALMGGGLGFLGGRAAGMRGLSSFLPAIAGAAGGGYLGGVPGVKSRFNRMWGHTPGSPQATARDAAQAAAGSIVGVPEPGERSNALKRLRTQ